MSRNQLTGVLVALVVVGAGGFFAGKWQAASAASTPTLNPTGTGGFAGRTGIGRSGSGGGIGKIVSLGSGTIAIQMQNSSSSEIVLIGSQTVISKTVSGSASDLSVGSNIAVAGSSNSDGSISANSIQILPAGAAGRFGGFGASSATQGQTSPAPLNPTQ